MNELRKKIQIQVALCYQGLKVFDESYSTFNPSDLEKYFKRRENLFNEYIDRIMEEIEKEKA